MPDSTTAAIDRLFDFVDKGVEKIDHVLNRGRHTQDQHRDRRAKPVKEKQPKIIDAAASLKTTKPSTASSLVRKPRFYIVESVTSGTTRFVVTDGGEARWESATRELAEKLLRALEAV